MQSNARQSASPPTQSDVKPSQRPISWNRQHAPEALHSILEILGRDYPIVETLDAPTLGFKFHPNAVGLNCRNSDTGVFTVECSSVRDALRGIGHALAGQPACEASSFRSLGIMLDCSRNAVMTIPYLKSWVRQLALLGYNRLMLYTEDTYELPDEPYFGYMRGGYRADEIREIDTYAAALGVEIIACIQTLGHLHQILKHKHYTPIRDTNGVLLVDGEATYDLITKMIHFWGSVLQSRRIHVGMDEAHELGRGRFLDQFGWQPPFEIFSRHLIRVTAICREQGLQPMIWSDMFFRMGNPRQDYYDPETVIPESVREQIPGDVSLVYWDYSSTDEAFYREWIRRHRGLGSEPIMASGLWTWARFWYDHAPTKAAAEPCIQACRKEGVPDLLLTMWGDGGSYCEFDSAFAGIAWAADLAYGGIGSDEMVAPMVRGVCGGDYFWLLQGTRLQVQAPGDLPPVAPATMLWDDPLLGIGHQGYPAAVWSQVHDEYERLKQDLQRMPQPAGSTDSTYLIDLVETLLAKTTFRDSLLAAYEADDQERLKNLRDQEIPRIQSLIQNLAGSFRRQWLRRNKPFGMEVIQIRFGAMLARYDETARRIDEYLSGIVPAIDELEARRSDLGTNPVKYFYWLATGSFVI